MRFRVTSLLWMLTVESLGFAALGGWGFLAIGVVFYCWVFAKATSHKSNQESQVESGLLMFAAFFVCFCVTGFLFYQLSASAFSTSMPITKRQTLLTIAFQAVALGPLLVKRRREA